jgi:outer membrane protein OmpA-like peptidoglycan-associated protein
MSSFGFSSRVVSVLAVTIAASAATACGGVTAFQGKEAFAIAATPPPPPPAPPPPPVVEKAPVVPSKVEVAADHIDIKEKIQFEVNKAVIKEASFPLLNEIADVIKKNPQIKKLSIEGHSSSEGVAAQNQTLSEERAKAVRQYLVDKGGVKADALVSKGFGASKPIADNKTDDGREKNRRVEFNILEQDKTVTKDAAAAGTPATGTPAAKPAAGTPAAKPAAGAPAAKPGLTVKKPTGKVK